MISRRKVQIALGCLWLLDGALQLQSKFFTSDFANKVIAPAGTNQPGVVSAPLNLVVHILNFHPAFYNWIFALIQIALGVFILCKTTAKQALTASVIWGVLIWYLGEGLGGMLGGQTSLLVGAPGAALLYALIALGVLPIRIVDKKSEKDEQLPAYWLGFVWALLWAAGALYQLLPGQNSVADLSSTVSSNISSAPGWLTTLDVHVSNFIVSKDFWLIIFLAYIQLFIGVAVLVKWPLRKLAIMLGIVLALCYWVIGQNFGNLTSGLATDPSSGPLFVLLGIALLGSAQFSFKRLRNDVSKVAKRLESLLT